MQRLHVVKQLAAVVAVEDRNGHAPESLPRDAPVGPLGNHRAHALHAPGWRPLHFGNLLERGVPQRRRLGRWNIRASRIELYEPLLGGAEDDRVVAAPAVRIAMLQLALGKECAS